MNTYRNNAIIVGVLYILGTVAGILSAIFTLQVSNSSNYLTALSENENRVIAGALFIAVMGLVLAMVPVVLFPVLKKVNEVLALGYVVFRGALETVTYLAMFTCWLLLVSLARGYSVTENISAFQSLGKLLMEVHDTINLILVLVFGLGALMLYYLFYVSRLIPRWLSVWGLIAILMHLSTGFLGMFGSMDVTVSGGTLTLVLNFPIFLQEMVMAVWLIAKGFNASAVAQVIPKISTSEKQLNPA